MKFNNTFKALFIVVIGILGIVTNNIFSLQSMAYGIPAGLIGLPILNMSKVGRNVMLGMAALLALFFFLNPSELDTNHRSQFSGVVIGLIIASILWVPVMWPKSGFRLAVYFE